METIMEPPFFCFCGKQFSSGKAMGGHKKVHSQKRSEDDGPGKKKSPSPNLNNLTGGGGGGGISARTENGKSDVPLKKRKVIMEDGDEKNSRSTAAAGERYFCGVCGVCFQSHRSLAAHSGHHTKAARKMLRWKVDESSSSSSSSSSSDDDQEDDEDYDVNEDSEEEEEEEAESEAEKRMAFKCPYNCERVFRSGKALGGHKRHCRNRAAAAAAGLAGGHGREAAAAADEDRNDGGDNRINRFGFDLNEVPDSDDDEYNAAE